MTTDQQLVSSQLPQLPWQFDFPLAALTYFKIGGPAEVYLETGDVAVASQVVALTSQHQIKLTILGGASNVIVADEGITGVVLHLTHQTLEDLGPLDATFFKVRAGAGIKMAVLVSQVVNMGYQGLEYFLGVPGTLGGAVYNNSHYFMHLIGESIHAVQVIQANGELTWLSQADCAFGYDSSRFQTSKEVIWAVEFKLAQGDKAASQALIRETTEYRARTQPLGIPNSGCIFQNPVNTPQLKQLFPQFADKSHISGGFLIDQAGLKGTRLGDIEISQKHGAFFLNKGQGKASDVQKLIAKVKESVKARFGVELKEEVFYLS